MRTLIRNGTVVNAASRVVADVLVEDERVAAVAPAIGAAADRTIDASGLYVLPGGVDVHTHLDMPLGPTLRTSDDFTTGTIAAACGGTTTIVDYATQWPGGSLHAALDAWLARADGRAAIDFGFHMGISDLTPQVEAEMDALVKAGVPSFKVFMAYPGRLMLDDGAIFRVLRGATASGGLVCLHAENGPVIEVLVHEALRAGQTAPRFHARTRPAALEAEAVRRGIALAALAGARLYVVHLSSGVALQAVGEARARGLAVYGETCPQYLFLSDACYHGAPLDAARFVVSPPLRGEGCVAELWRGLAAGILDVVATDHCPFRLEDKARGCDDFTRVPNGAPGIEPRMLLMYDAVCEGRLSMERFVEVTAAAPATIFGLHPRKGAVAAGSDADLVLLDPGGTTEVSAATHHMRVDYNPYEGRRLRGAIRMVLARGGVLVEDGRFVGKTGHGQFLRRTAV